LDRRVPTDAALRSVQQQSQWDAAVAIANEPVPLGIAAATRKLFQWHPSEVMGDEHDAGAEATEHIIQQSNWAPALQLGPVASPSYL
jgi:hypothetical protein